MLNSISRMLLGYWNRKVNLTFNRDANYFRFLDRSAVLYEKVRYKKILAKKVSITFLALGCFGSRVPKTLELQISLSASGAVWIPLPNIPGSVFPLVRTGRGSLKTAAGSLDLWDGLVAGTARTETSSLLFLIFLARLLWNDDLSFW